MTGFTLVVTALFLTFKLSQFDSTLRILHTNRFCSNFEARGKGNKSRGGIGRIISYVNKQKAQHKATLYFDTMDWFTGSIWYSVHKMSICTEFMSILKVDALGLGEDEMYEGNATTIEKNFWKYINSICDKTILCANCVVSPYFDGGSCIHKSTVIKFHRVKVGVTAYVERVLVPAQSYKKMKFTDESEAVNQETERLKRQGINIIIVIGHGSFRFNAELVRKLVHVDLVIGGHAPELLYNGNPPEGVSNGPYPQTLKNANGNDVLLGYAGEYGLYVGSIVLTLDKLGRVTHSIGNTYYMGADIREDPAALKMLESFRPEVDKYRTRVVGKSKVFLDAGCTERECNLGNFLADALIYHRANQWAGMKGRYWTDAAIAFVNSGNMKQSIAVENNTVVMAELMASLPYSNALYTITLNGSILKQVFEHSGYLLGEGLPGFLQVAGLHVVYDLNKAPNEKVVSLRARCAKCKVPLYEEVKDDKIYKAVTIEFLVGGGDGYTFGDEQPQKIHYGSDVDILKQYLQFCQNVKIGQEERIMIRRKIKPSTSRSSEYMKENISRNLLLFTWILYLYNIFDHVSTTSGTSLPFKFRNLYY